MTITVSKKDFYSQITGEINSMYVVLLDGVHVDSFSNLEYVHSFVHGLTVGLRIQGNKVNVINDYVVKL